MYSISSFSNHASVLISLPCLGPGLSHVLLNMGVGYLNYIRKKMGNPHCSSKDSHQTDIFRDW